MDSTLTNALQHCPLLHTFVAELKSCSEVYGLTAALDTLIQRSKPPFAQSLTTLCVQTFSVPAESYSVASHLPAVSSSISADDLPAVSAISADLPAASSSMVSYPRDRRGTAYPVGPTLDQSHSLNTAHTAHSRFKEREHLETGVPSTFILEHGPSEEALARLKSLDASEQYLQYVDYKQFELIPTDILSKGEDAKMDQEQHCCENKAQARTDHPSRNVEHKHYANAGDVKSLVLQWINQLNNTDREKQPNVDQTKRSHGELCIKCGRRLPSEAMKLLHQLHDARPNIILLFRLCNFSCDSRGELRPPLGPLRLLG